MSSWYCCIQWYVGLSRRISPIRRTRRFWSSCRLFDDGTCSTVAPRISSWILSVRSTVVEPTMWHFIPYRWQASASACA